ALVFQGEWTWPMKTRCASASIAAGSRSSAISPSRDSNMRHIHPERPRHFLVRLRHSLLPSFRNRHKHIFISELQGRQHDGSTMTVTLDDLVDTLKAAAETSRLRILALLSLG